MALRPTTALREPANYGLRGWISTRSSELAQVILGSLLRYFRMVVCEERIGRHLQPSGGNALGIYQGSASGMKMSKGQIGRRLLGLTAAGMALVVGGTAFAELGQPAPWEYTLQESATPVMDYITWFHNWLLGTITVITLFVLALLV